MKKKLITAMVCVLAAAIVCAVVLTACAVAPEQTGAPAAAEESGAKTENVEKLPLSVTSDNEELKPTEGLAFAIGDFNADPRYPEDGMAMYPSAGWADIPLNVTTDPGKAGENILYSPLIDEGGAEGTYWYMDGWYFYDNALLCSSIFSSSEWRYASSRVIRPFEAEDILGRPDAYDASTGSGYSDHFPIEVTFVSF